MLKQGAKGKVACVSCPSIFRACESVENGNFIKITELLYWNRYYANLDIKKSFVCCAVHLFEFDKRFKAFGSSYHFYDYNEPEQIPDSCVSAFSVVIADPPFLSEECLEKVALTVKKLIKENGKIILCSG